MLLKHRNVLIQLSFFTVDYVCVYPVDFDQAFGIRRRLFLTLLLLLAIPLPRQLISLNTQLKSLIATQNMGIREESRHHVLGLDAVRSASELGGAS